MTIAVVGGSLAGLRVVESLRKLGWQDEIVIFSDELRFPYNRPPLSKSYLTGLVDDPGLALELRLSAMEAEWAIGERIESSDLENQTVTSTNRTLKFSYLIAASGLRSRRSPSLSPSFTLRSIEDGSLLRGAMSRASTVVIAGGGFIGCEVAASAVSIGLRAVLVTPRGSVLEDQIGADLGTEAQARLESRGVVVVNNCRVERYDGGVAELSSGESIESGLLLDATGSSYNVEWLSGNDLDISHGVLTDGHLRAVRLDGSPWPNVLAIGDVARFPNPRFDGLPRPVGHLGIATESARHAAKVICADAGLSPTSPDPFAPLPYFWSDLFDFTISGYGHPALANRTEIAEVTPSGTLYRYWLNDDLVAVAGIGMKAAVLRHRNEFPAGPFQTQYPTAPEGA